MMFLTGKGEKRRPKRCSCPAAWRRSGPAARSPTPRPPRSAAASSWSGWPWRRRPSSPGRSSTGCGLFWPRPGHPGGPDALREPAVTPELLDLLAGDWPSNGYDLKRLIAAWSLSRAYPLASEKAAQTSEAAPATSPCALRPLTPTQTALSLGLATGDDSFDQAADPEATTKRYRELENRAAALIAANCSSSHATFQISVSEALFMFNHAACRS